MIGIQRLHLINIFTTVLLVLSIFGLPAAAASASSTAVIQVNTVEDELNGDGDCSLREAIQAANTNLPVSGCVSGSGSDTIIVPAGTYQLAIPGAGEDANQTGDLDLTSDIVLLGAGINMAFVDGGGLDRVFHIASPGQVQVQVWITGVTIQNGLAGSSGLYGGGGVLNQTGYLTMNNVRLFQNHAENTGGGLDSASGTNLFRVSLENNTAVYGGGIFNGATIYIDNATISGNTASHTGGGLDNSGTATLKNVTFSGNTASATTIIERGAGGGGGLFNDGSIDSVNITIYANSSGIANSGTIRFKNSLVANSLTGPNCNGIGAFTSLGYNLDSGNTCNFSRPDDWINVADPLLGPLQDNQGATKTHALLTGSPAIDHGTNMDCPTKDQRGANRPVDGDQDSVADCDIGAYEYEANPYFLYLPAIRR